MLRNLLISMLLQATILVFLAACNNHPRRPPGVSIANASVIEGDSGNSILSFAVSRDIRLLRSFQGNEASVSYATIDGSATVIDGDYVSQTGTISFVNNIASTSIDIVINGDTFTESDETITVILFDPVNLRITDATAIGTIITDDGSSLSIENASLVEGDSGTDVMFFTLTLDAYRDVASVDFTTTDNTATISDNDYLPQSGTITFAGGSTNESIEIVINGDTLTESNEQLLVTLSNPKGLQITDASAIGTIITDDLPGLNDTGVNWAGEHPSGNKSANDCSTATITANQDCDQGRDVTNNDNSNGLAGFDFTKLNATGAVLADQSASGHACVRDNVTGLTWEVKATSGIRINSDKYAWGGLTAIGINHPDREGTYSSDWDALINHANLVETLCGYSDWRVPTIGELRSIVSQSSTAPTIDINYFPNTLTDDKYWSSSPDAESPSDARRMNFNSGFDGRADRSNLYYIRMVRGG